MQMNKGAKLPHPTTDGDDQVIAAKTGEYVLPPEVVAMIGVDKLDAMVAQMTGKQPGGKPAMMNDMDMDDMGMMGHAKGGMVERAKMKPGMKPPMKMDMMGYAAGGVIDPDKIQMGDKYRAANRSLVSGIAGAFPNTTAAIKGAGDNIADAYRTGGIPAAAGATVRNTMVPAIGLADDVMTGAKIAIDPFANALKTAVTGDATPIAKAQAQTPTSPLTAGVGSPVNPNAQPTVQDTVAQPSTVQPNPQPLTAGIDLAGSNAAMERANAIRQSALDGAGRNGPGGGAIGGADRDQAERNAMSARWNADTAIQHQTGTRSTRDGLVSMARNAQSIVDGIDARGIENRKGDLAFDKLASDERIGLSKLAQDQQALDAQAGYRNAQARGMNAEAAGKEGVQNLLTQINAEQDPVKRNALVQNLNLARGGTPTSAKDRYITLKGGQTVDPNGMTVTYAPDVLFDAQTQQPVNLRGGQQAQQQYQEGKTYTDGDGNKAVYRNGQWQEVK